MSRLETSISTRDERFKANAAAMEKLTGELTSRIAVAAQPNVKSLLALVVFWNLVRPYIGAGIDYLKVTHSGRQWLSGLYSHVFYQEHRARL